MAINGVYRFLYYTKFLKVQYTEVPLEISIGPCLPPQKLPNSTFIRPKGMGKIKSKFFPKRLLRGLSPKDMSRRRKDMEEAQRETERIFYIERTDGDVIERKAVITAHESFVSLDDVSGISIDDKVTSGDDPSPLYGSHALVVSVDEERKVVELSEPVRVSDERALLRFTSAVLLFKLKDVQLLKDIERKLPQKEDHEVKQLKEYMAYKMARKIKKTFDKLFKGKKKEGEEEDDEEDEDEDEDDEGEGEKNVKEEPEALKDNNKREAFDFDEHGEPTSIESAWSTKDPSGDQVSISVDDAASAGPGSPTSPGGTKKKGGLLDFFGSAAKERASRLVSLYVDDPGQRARDELLAAKAAAAAVASPMSPKAAGSPNVKSQKSPGLDDGEQKESVQGSLSSRSLSTLLRSGTKSRSGIRLGQVEGADNAESVFKLNLSREGITEFDPATQHEVHAEYEKARLAREEAAARATEERARHAAEREERRKLRLTPVQRQALTEKVSALQAKERDYHALRRELHELRKEAKRKAEEAEVARARGEAEGAGSPSKESPTKGRTVLLRSMGMEILSKRGTIAGMPGGVEALEEMVTDEDWADGGWTDSGL